MTGLEALARGIAESGVRLVTGVPGYPITGVMDWVRALGLPWLLAEWSVNEKAALEMAAGCSVAGWRALFLAKHVGLNVASDPLVAAVTHGIGAGLVCLVGDDPEALGSWNAQDSRWVARLGEIAVLEPAAPEQAREMMIGAFGLSEQIHAPVMVRITDALAAATGEGGTSPLQPAACRQQPPLDAGAPWATSRLGAHERYGRDAWPVLAAASEQAVREWPAGRDEGAGTAIVAAGPATRMARATGLPVLQVGLSYPIPERALARFISNRETIVAAEDGAPVLEHDLQALAGRLGLAVKVVGRTTGHLPRYRRFTAHDLLHVAAGGRCSTADAPVPPDGWAICPDCRYELAFRVLAEEVPAGHLVAGDAGCSLNAVYSHPGSIDLSFGLGSAPGVASGLSLGQGKSVAVVGDLGLLHSGLGGLMNAAALGLPLLLVVFDNGVCAQTGGQPSPHVDLIQAIRACGISNVTIVGPGPDGNLPEDFRAQLRRHLAQPGPSAVVVRIPCTRYGGPTG